MSDFINEIRGEPKVIINESDDLTPIQIGHAFNAGRKAGLEEAASLVDLGFGLKWDDLTWDAAKATTALAASIRARLTQGTDRG
jgi:hypothetical protein